MAVQDLDNNCATCGSTTTKKCGKCCKVHYCCRDCQVKDWKNHKLNCNPFEIKESSGKGLGLFATCDLNIGDLIVRPEHPILFFEGGSIGILDNPETFKETFEALSREKKDLILDLTGADSVPTMWNTRITGLSQDSSSNEVEEEW